MKISLLTRIRSTLTVKSTGFSHTTRHNPGGLTAKWCLAALCQFLKAHWLNEEQSFHIKTTVNYLNHGKGVICGKQGGKCYCETQRNAMSSFQQGGSNQDKEQTQTLWKHRMMCPALSCLFSPLHLYFTVLTIWKWITRSSWRTRERQLWAQWQQSVEPRGIRQLCNWKVTSLTPTKTQC